MRFRNRFYWLAAAPSLVFAQHCGASSTNEGAAGSGAATGGGGITGNVGGTNGAGAGTQGGAGGSSGAAAAACKADGGSAPVHAPVFVRNLAPGETGWFSSPAVVDLDGDGKNEIVVPLYSTFIYDAEGNQKAKGTATAGRVYAPGVVADLDHDGQPEVVVGGNDGTVAAYNYKGGALSVKAGWPASTSSGGQDPEARGMAAADLDGDGTIEIVVTTTDTANTGSQVFVFGADGKVYQPAGTSFTAWPRYNTATGPGGDADFNGYGNHGYGCYGENVGIGNIDDDPNPEIIVTYDNHQINAFHHDGTSVLASSYYTDPQTKYAGQPLGWGQFIRWADMNAEDTLYHDHGAYPDLAKTPWLQWTASPPNVVDIDGDGKNDVVGIPNTETDPSGSGMYETQGYAFVVLHGAQGGGSQSARRVAAFETLPTTDKPALRDGADYYPPSGIPAPTTVDVDGDARPDILAPGNDGYIYAVGSNGERLWRYDFAKGAAKTFASEVAVADLNRDGTPEAIFGTYSLTPGGGHLVILSATGALLSDTPLPNQGTNGNGIGVPAAPTIADVDGDGVLEILLTTFDHGVDIFSVPGSGTACLAWPTGRGSYLRAGRAPE